jgi:hypothetical protein
MMTHTLNDPTLTHAEVDEWAIPVTECTITTEDLDNAIIAMKEKKEIYEEAKAASTTAYKIYEDAEYRVIQLLETCGKTKYIVDGVGTASSSTKLSYPTPKTREQKEKFFEYLKSQSEDIFYAYASVNSQSLNSFCKEAYENGADHIPGIDEPTEQKTLRFTSAKPKKK